MTADPYTCSVLCDPFGPAITLEETDRLAKREWDALADRVHQEAFAEWLRNRNAMEGKP